jgi:HPt (histidine-containing phosphotransfer) domain-containing protein
MERWTRLQGLVEHALVAPHVRTAGYDIARRGRLQANFVLAFISLPCVFLTLGMILGGFGAPSMIAMVVELFVLGAALAVLRTRGWLAVSGNVLVGVYYAVTMVSLVTTGGLTTTNGSWLLLCPLMALLLVGARSGLVWLSVIVATVIAAVHMHAAGLIPSVVLPESLFVLATAINIVGCTLVSFGCAFLYESSKRHMLAEVDSARRDAEHAFTGARLVLDHIEEALMIVRRDGTIEPECSASVARILGGKLEPSESIWSLFARIDARAARWVELGWPEIFDDVMPEDLVLAQLPARLERDGRVLAATYATVSIGERVLVMVRDVTDAIAAETAEREERQIVQLLARLARDRATFLGFWDELSDLVTRLADSTRSREQIARDLHTLKGNAGILGLEAFARLCHDAEDRGVEAGVAVTAVDRTRIAAAFRQIDERMQTVVGIDSDAISVPRRRRARAIAERRAHLGAALVGPRLGRTPARAARGTVDRSRAPARQGRDRGRGGRWVHARAPRQVRAVLRSPRPRRA